MKREHFLDTLPFDFSRPESKELLELLERIIFEPPEIKRLLQAAGVSLGDLYIAQSAKGLWHDAVERARNQDRLRVLLETIHGDPSYKALRIRLKEFLIEHPTKTVGTWHLVVLTQSQPTDGWAAVDVLVRRLAHHRKDAADALQKELAILDAPDCDTAVDVVHDLRRLRVDATSVSCYRMAERPRIRWSPIGAAMLLISGDDPASIDPDSGSRVQPAIWFAIKPVTQALYSRVMSVNTLREDSMATVPWDDARAFCERLSSLELVKTNPYRLPTEAECRWAASRCAGMFDLSGHRYEWTADRSYNEVTGKDPSTPIPFRMVRTNTLEDITQAGRTHDTD